MRIIDGFEHVVRENEPLGPHNWFRLGGPAEFFAEPTSIDELQTLVGRCREQEVPVRLLGSGSNVLVRDEGTPGLVLHLAAPAFCEISVHGDRIRAGGGAKLAHVISTSVREGLAGLEQLVGIPGTVGGAIHGNSGTQNHDVGQATAAATVMTRSGDIIERGLDDLRFSYRDSSLDELVILSAQFHFDREDPRELTKRMQTQWIIQRSLQPAANLNGVPVFKNSSGVSASALIDQAGLKGTRIGHAEISDEDPNFVIAHVGASSQDVLRLIDLVKGRVHEYLGVELETNLEIW